MSPGTSAPEAVDLLGTLGQAGVQLWEETGRLRYRAPAGALTPGLRQALSDRRDEVLERLRRDAEPLVPDPAARHDPFPLTDVQSAYLLGRRGTFAYGGVGCHGYGELEFDDLDPDRLSAAWQAVVRRHDMLRAVIRPDGTQQVLADPPPYRIVVDDLRGRDAAAVRDAVARTRAELSHRVYDPSIWPLFTLRLTRGTGQTVLHVSVDLLIADFASTRMLLAELERRYSGRTTPTDDVPMELSFRDYVLAQRRGREGAAYARDRAYWRKRLDQLPPAPELPGLGRGRQQAVPRFERWQARLEPDEWSRLRSAAAAAGVTGSGAVLAAYADVLGRWCRQPRFTLNLTLLNRRPLHPRVADLVGDFTSVELLAVEPEPDSTFAARASALQARLWSDLDHRLFTGVDAVRELSRRGGATQLYPVVFTAAIGAEAAADRSSAEPGGFGLGRFRNGITQTPQVALDCQVSEAGGGLDLNWDVRAGVFPPGVVDAAFDAFRNLLLGLASDPGSWTAADPVPLPADQAAARARLRETAPPNPDTLHGRVARAALRGPDRPAVIAAGRTVSHAELLGRALAVTRALAAAGLAAGERVAVTMAKGPEQVAGVLGILLAGGAYVPVDAAQPALRRDAILAEAAIRLALAQSWCPQAAPRGAGITTIDVDRLGPEPLPATPEDLAAAPGVRRSEPDDLAYVIYTSGSTGSPKGVMITHRAAVNTVVDIDRRFGVGAGDRVLGLAALGFDLSVYDLFGPLAHGGCLVLPEPDRRRDPAHWAELIAAHGVTLWNSVPAQLQMLEEYLASEGPAAPGLDSLRLALLSGDWIPVALPDQVRGHLPGLRLVALGGATEAAIWSNFHPIGTVDPSWPSIPYGRPLTNQTMQVLDALGRPCPDWTIGEIHIGGAGLALGYLGDPERTAGRFITHPRTGERLYRTGDLGRHRPGGEIEFLGREDRQVKIRGHRIELAEVEAALADQEGVGGAVALVDGEPPAERRLVAVVVPARVPPDSFPPVAPTDPAPFPAARPDAYADHLCALDEAALVAMRSAVQALGDLEAGRTRPEAKLVEAVPEPGRRAFRRWLRALTDVGLLTVEAGADGEARYRAPGRTPDFGPAWAAVQAAARAAGDAVDPLAIEFFHRCLTDLPALVTGRTDALTLLFPEGGQEVADALYEGSAAGRWSASTMASVAAAIAAAGTPGGGPLRVLEIGAGGGATTAAVLAGLRGAGAVEYLATDVSAFFLDRLQQRFASLPAGVAFRTGVFDVEDEPAAAGLAPNSFDLLVAGDVLHATSDPDAVLGRLTGLLASGGWLVAGEMTRDHPHIMASLELLLDRGPDGSPFRSAEEWCRALARVGATQVRELQPADDPLASVGAAVFAGQVKADRAPVRAATVREQAAARLPEHMLPTQLLVVDGLPLTANGKVDHAQLRRLLPRAAHSSEQTRPGTADSSAVRRFGALWAEVLGVGAVRPEQNFFELGGDSLLAATLARRAREELPEAAGARFDDLLRHVLERQTVTGVLTALAGAGPAGAEPGPAEPDASGRTDGREVLARLADGDPTGPVRVLVHDGSGTLTAYRHLVPLLAAVAGGGAVVGLQVADPDEVAGTPAEVLVDRWVTRYGRALAAAAGAHPVFQVIGAGTGVLLATELAGALVASGARVERTLLVLDAPDADPPDARLPAAIRAATELSAAEAEPYPGDLTLVVGADSAASSTRPWRDRCLGDVVEVTAPDRLEQPWTAELARLVAASLSGGEELR